MTTSETGLLKNFKRSQLGRMLFNQIEIFRDFFLMHCKCLNKILAKVVKWRKSSILITSFASRLGSLLQSNDLVFCGPNYRYFLFMLYFESISHGEMYTYAMKSDQNSLLSSSVFLDDAYQINACGFILSQLIPQFLPST